MRNRQAAPLGLHSASSLAARLCMGSMVLFGTVQLTACQLLSGLNDYSVGTQSTGGGGQGGTGGGLGGAGGSSLGLRLTVPAEVRLVQGETVEVAVTVERDGFEGPINLDVTDLPTGVTASEASLAINQNSGVVELTATSDATPAVANISIGATSADGAVGDESVLSLVIAGLPGSLDTSFGDGGTLVVPTPNPTAVAFRMAVAADGAIVFVAKTDTTGWRIVMLSPDGLVNRAFSPGPEVVGLSGEVAEAAFDESIDPPNIVVVGTSVDAAKSQTTFLRLTGLGQLVGAAQVLATANGSTGEAIAVSDTGEVLISGMREIETQPDAQAVWPELSLTSVRAESVNAIGAGYDSQGRAYATGTVAGTTGYYLLKFNDAGDAPAELAFGAQMAGFEATDFTLVPSNADRSNDSVDDAIICGLGPAGSPRPARSSKDNILWSLSDNPIQGLGSSHTRCRCAADTSGRVVMGLDDRVVRLQPDRTLDSGFGTDEPGVGIGDVQDVAIDPTTGRLLVLSSVPGSITITRLWD